ncbi:hypothetical protein HOG16_02580 [Candidatus Woesearchaeota archaeon]|jgi:hypothetical protein|nr:hypothetical protein [Candidatus Woesearchaeota archaeon]MBT4321983.1 hypothetical protein [Candidatus Woesearchaeota archaeon]MBT4631335.1 hypothetical protein [Candidatus Woesearchaeota archaeon]
MNTNNKFILWGVIVLVFSFVAIWLVGPWIFQSPLINGLVKYWIIGVPFIGLALVFYGILSYIKVGISGTPKKIILVAVSLILGYLIARYLLIGFFSLILLNFG